MAKLIVQEGPGSGTAYELLDDRVAIGRDPSNTIQIPSEAVSRNHAVVSRATDDEGEFWTVKDLNSKNGVLLNRKRISEARLASGDELALGECVLRFVERDFDALGAEDVSDRGSRLVMRDTLDRETVSTRPVAPAPAGAEARRQLMAPLRQDLMAQIHDRLCVLDDGDYRIEDDAEQSNLRTVIIRQKPGGAEQRVSILTKVTSKAKLANFVRTRLASIFPVRSEALRQALLDLIVGRLRPNVVLNAELTRARQELAAEEVNQVELTVNPGRDHQP